MRPSSKRPIGHSTAGLAVVVGISVKVGDFADAVSCGVRGDGADVEDAKAGLVVGLVGETVVLFVFFLVSCCCCCSCHVHQSGYYLR